LVTRNFFTYKGGVYSSDGQYSNDNFIGMLDVTIIGWGQNKNILSASSEKESRWWYIIPHFGTDFGLNCSELMDAERDSSEVIHSYINQTYSKEIHVFYYQTPSNSENSTILENGFTFNFGNGVKCNSLYYYTDTQTGIVKYIRRYDDSGIESNAVGAIPYNFNPEIYGRQKT